MTLLPIVRHMILCQDWNVDDGASLLINVRGLLTSIRSVELPAYPMDYAELCLLVFLTECRGAADVMVTCVDDEHELVIYESRTHRVHAGDDPLAVVVFPFRMTALHFPGPGVYRFELWYNAKVLAEQPLRLR